MRGRVGIGAASILAKEARCRDASLDALHATVRRSQGPLHEGSPVLRSAGAAEYDARLTADEIIVLAFLLKRLEALKAAA